MSGEIGPLDRGSIVPVEVVDDGDLITCLQQYIEQVAADKSSAARKQNPPARHLKSRELARDLDFVDDAQNHAVKGVIVGA